MSENLALELTKIWREIERLQQREAPVGATGAGGGFRFYRYAAIAAVAQTIVPDAINDVVRGLRIMWVGYTSGGAFFTGSSSCANGASLDLYNVLGDILTLSVAAGGAATVVRTGGALTYDLAAWLVWL